MSNGIYIQGKDLMLDNVVVAVGGDGNDKLHADGNNLIFDSKVLATSAGREGLYLQNNNLFFNKMQVVDEPPEPPAPPIYPQGLTQIFYNKLSWASYNDRPLSTGAKQGGAVHNGKWYQFYAGGRIRVYDIETGVLKYEFDIPAEQVPTSYEVDGSEWFHCGSAQFSDEYENESDIIPLVYVTWRYHICVYNINNNTGRLIRWFNVPHLENTGAIAAFDFNNGVGWSIGYPANTGKPHKQSDYEVIPFTFPKSGFGDISNNVTIDTANTFIIPNVGSNLQDADYSNGHIFILIGGTNGSTTDFPKIVDWDIAQSSSLVIDTNIKKGDGSGEQGAEGEGFALYANGFMISVLYGAEWIYVI